MNTNLKFIVPLLLAGMLPARVWACPACYGVSDSPLAEGMNWGILTLLGVVGTVLTCFLVFFVHIVRKSEAATEAAETAAGAAASDSDKTTHV